MGASPALRCCLFKELAAASGLRAPSKRQLLRAAGDVLQVGACAVLSRGAEDGGGGTPRPDLEGNLPGGPLRHLPGASAQHVG